MKLPLLILSIASPVLPLLIGSRRRYPILWSYLLVCLISDILIVVLKRVLVSDHLWIGDVFLLLQFLLVSFYYKRSLSINSKIFITSIVILLSTYVYLAGNDHTPSFNGKGAAILFLSFMIYSIAGFYKIQKENIIVRLESSSTFWVNVAILVYSSGCFLIFLFKSYLLEHNEALFKSLWIWLILSLNIFKNGILAIGMSRKN